MSSKKKKDRILSDIRHFQAMVDTEQRKIGEDINHYILSKKGEEASFEALVSRLSHHMAKLNARMQVVETVLASELPVSREVSDKVVGTVATSKAKIAYLALPKKVDVLASELSGTENYGNLEVADNGLSYCWTQENPSIEIPAKISRDQEVQVQVKFMSLILPELKNSVQLWVDGSKLEHSIQFADGVELFQAILPVKKGKKDVTILTVKLSSTFSPQQLGTSQDGRKLGLALHKVEFQPAPKRKRKGFFSRGK